MFLQTLVLKVLHHVRRLSTGSVIQFLLPHQSTMPKKLTNRRTRRHPSHGKPRHPVRGRQHHPLHSLGQWTPRRHRGTNGEATEKGGIHPRRDVRMMGEKAAKEVRRQARARAVRSAVGQAVDLDCLDRATFLRLRREVAATVQVCNAALLSICVAGSLAAQLLSGRGVLSALFLVTKFCHLAVYSSL